MINLDLEEYSRIKHKTAMLNIASALSSSDIPYCFIKSSSLALQGLPIHPNDIDIETTAKGAYNIQRLLKPIGNLLKEIEAKESTLKTMDEKITNLKIAKDLYTRESEKIKLVDEAIPDKPKPDNLALQIEELAKSTGVIVSNMSIEDSILLGDRQPDDDKILTLTLNVTGAYTNLINFASDLENLRRPSRIDAAGMASSQSVEGQTLTLVISARTPYIQVVSNTNK